MEEIICESKIKDINIENETFGLKLKPEHLCVLLEWFDENHEHFNYNNEKIEGIKIEKILKFLEIKKFHIRDFHYPTYEEFMKEIEKLNIAHFLTKMQYVTLIQQWIILPKIKDELKLAFKLFDTEKRGFIMFDELKTILTSMGSTFEDNEIVEILRDADVWGNGNIIYNEFTESLFSLIPELYNLEVEYLYENASDDPSLN